jgi:hypothetical protein
MLPFAPIESPNPAYARRINHETGHFESVCRHCYRTIAVSSNPDMLTQVEWKHDCPEQPKAEKLKKAA